MPPSNRNITFTANQIPLQERWSRSGRKSGILWFTGLSGAGKTTLSLALGCVLDGDNVRHGLSSDLSFSARGREENIRRVSETAKLFAEAGLIVILAFISPFRADRDRARVLAGDLFHEIFIDAGIEACLKRDPKGLYAKAIEGKISDFTGISAPYEAPGHPDLRVPTQEQNELVCLQLLEAYAKRVFSL